MYVRIAKRGITMGKLNNKLRSDFQKMFGSRVSFHRLERKLYGHDIAAIPSLVKLIIRKAIPDAVVQPQIEKELVKLVRWATRHGILITPRGKASSAVVIKSAGSSKLVDALQIMP